MEACALGALRSVAEAAGRDDFSPLWAGQSFPLAKPMSAAALPARSDGPGEAAADRPAQLEPVARPGLDVRSGTGLSGNTSRSSG